MPGDRVCCAMFPPLAPLEASLIDPGFVHVDDSFARSQKIKHLDCKLLSKHQISLRIACVWDPFDSFVLETKSFAKYLSDQSICDILAVIHLDEVLHYGGLVDLLILRD